MSWKKKDKQFLPLMKGQAVTLHILIYISINLLKMNLKKIFFLSCSLELGTKEGKISAQPHTTLCIQFLDRENNDKNNTLPWENRFVLQ